MIENVYPSQKSLLGSYKSNYIEKFRGTERLSGIVARYFIKLQLSFQNSIIRVTTKSTSAIYISASSASRPQASSPAAPDIIEQQIY